MPVHDDLGTRMKEYERRNRYYLQRRMPVIIRLDMRAGHSFTKGFQRPFDNVFVKAMQETAKYLCENVQNCKLAYVQSDEITLLLIDYEKLETDVFFDNRVDKLCSITASMATMAFNKAFDKAFEEFGRANFDDWDYGGTNEPVDENLMKLCEVYDRAANKSAMFDARCFNIPKEEVTNNFYWRQLDATRNSIQMVGQANFSHKELFGKTCNMIQDMLHEQKGINWNDYPTHLKRGSCCIKVVASEPDGTNTVARSKWIIDKEIPIFKDEGREYIERFI